MIIDSHAHYAYPKFQTEFPYLCEEDGNWTIRRGTRDDLLAEMQKNGIAGFIEPSIGFDAIEGQMALVEAHPTCMWAALGVHPTRCIHTPRKNRAKLRARAEQACADGARIVAIGETGLDYHYPRGQQHRLRQKQWFAYQIKLADDLKLPLVLHIRDADGDALRILRRHKTKLHGGVVHCFGGDLPTAEAYVDLGYALGIGGKILWDDEEARRLSETVRRIPLSALVVETDAPFVFPDIGDGIGGKNQRKKLCNTSLILPAVIRRIAELRGEPAEAVEEAVYQNTIRVFPGIRIGKEGEKSMKQTEFRLAKERDAGLILRFIRELAAYEKMSDQVVADEALIREWVFEKHKAEVIFALEDGVEVGFALFFHNFSTFLGRAGIYLEDLFVMPDYRGRGHGKALICELARIAVERGCGRLEWSCLDWNQPSIDFYLALGARQMQEWTTYRLAGESLRRVADLEK